MVATQKWPQHRLPLPSAPSVRLCSQDTCTHTRDRGRTRGGLSEAHLPPVCTKLWFEVVHLTVLRANSYSQMVIHNCRQGRTEASV